MENGRMSQQGRGRPRETSHDEIRAIALDLFVRDGYAATSLSQIAQAAGISRTTLFAYFPAKRNLLWEDFDERLGDLDDVLTDAADRPLVDVIVDGMLASSRYRRDEHNVVAMRMRIVGQDEELRAYTVLAAQDLTNRLYEGAIRRAPSTDPGLLDLVIRALVAAAARCTEQWAASDQPAQDLDAYTADRLRLITEALRPLL